MKTISIIPFIVSAPVKVKNTSERDKLTAFARLKASRKLFSESIEYDVEREEAMNEKHGFVFITAFGKNGAKKQETFLDFLLSNCLK